MNHPWRQTQWRQRQWRHLRHCVRNEKKIVCEGVAGRQAKHEDKSFFLYWMYLEEIPDISRLFLNQKL